MQKLLRDYEYHINDFDWKFTKSGDLRGYIETDKLKELWFHTGTICNLNCPVCFEGSSPKSNRIEQLSLEDIKPYIKEALEIGVKQFSFTGGEPFVNKDFINILDYALNYKDCLVLTNATEPLLNKLDEIKKFKNKPYKLKFRVSLDSFDENIYDKIRGKGKFRLTIEAMKKLINLGFEVSVATQSFQNNQSNIYENFQKLFKQYQLPEFIDVIPFEDLKKPHQQIETPEISKTELYKVKTAEEISNIMCSFSRMVLKKNGQTYVYACTLVDDDERYNLGTTLQESVNKKVVLKHHRCYLCFTNGISCSELLDKKIRSTKNILKESPTKVNRNNIKEYYGQILKTKQDLKTSACCSAEAVPEHIKEILPLIEEEILDKFYGCGSPIPLDISGCTVIDLGCGTGRDSYIVSKLVGENGKIIGIDMTDEQIGIAKKYLSTMMRKFGYQESNIEFIKGYIEELDILGIPDNSVDVIISNCVINLSFDKEKLLKEIFRVLKPGGELYFSDIFANRRIPEELKNDPVLIGECLAGAFYTEDFRRAVSRLGYPDVRIVSSKKIEIFNPEIKRKLGRIEFYSQTVRVFKIDDLEDRCEDYGQIAIYKGAIPESPHYFELDDHHIFEKDLPVRVCGNTASILTKSRYSKHFNVIGDRSKHYGLFNLNPSIKTDTNESNGCGC